MNKYDRIIRPISANEAIHIILDELMGKNYYIVNPVGPKQANVYFINDILLKYKGRKKCIECVTKYITFTNGNIFPDPLEHEQTLDILAEYLLKDNTWSKLKDNPDIHREFINGVILDSILRKYKKHRIKELIKMIKRLFNKEETVPAKGEQVFLEDGTFVIGDGIHTVKELPKPIVLND